MQHIKFYAPEKQILNFINQFFVLFRDIVYVVTRKYPHNSVVNKVIFRNAFANSEHKNTKQYKI